MSGFRRLRWSTIYTRMTWLIHFPSWIENDMCKILLLPGMTPDHRIFDRLLPLLPNAVVVDWIPPIGHDSIVSYAARLSRTLNIDEPNVVCGVSFGGIVARELACQVNAACCVLVSTVRSPRELPPWFRICRVIPRRLVNFTLKFSGSLASTCPGPLRSSLTWRLKKFSGKYGAWYRWATAAVLSWRPSQSIDHIPVIQIHGDRDRIFPIKYTSADVVIRGGGHSLAFTHHDEIAMQLRRISL